MAVIAVTAALSVWLPFAPLQPDSSESDTESAAQPASQPAAALLDCDLDKSCCHNANNVIAGGE